MRLRVMTTTTMVILMEEQMNEAEGDDYNNDGSCRLQNILSICFIIC